jgi:hypothetical protein
VTALLLAAVAGSLTAHGKQREDEIKFTMVRSAAATNAGCLPNARARVEIESLGPVEKTKVKARGLPANTEFDFFVIQVPNTPFGLSWYQGDIETNRRGTGTGKFIGRFHIETFIVAPGTAPPPVVHDQPPFPDADSNPATWPVHTFHLGLWFNSPADAAAATSPTTRGRSILGLRGPLALRILVRHSHRRLSPFGTRRALRAREPQPPNAGTVSEKTVKGPTEYYVLVSVKRR